MKKNLLLPLAALMSFQVISLTSLAQERRQPRPGADGGVQCWTNGDGTQQCQGGDYITPGDDRRDDRRNLPPRDDRRRPNPPDYPPSGRIDPYQPQDPTPYYPPTQPSEPYYPPQDPTPYYPPAQPSEPYYPPSAPYNPGMPASYSLQQFQYEEQQALSWNQSFNQAPSGSWDERYARDQRDQAIARALQNLQDPRAFDSMSLFDVENFGEQQNQKFNQASSGSALERMYNQSRSIAYAALDRVLQLEVQRLNYDWRQLERLAADLEQKFNQAPSGSAKERAYNQARMQAYGALPQAVQSEVQRMYDFRQVEPVADYFQQVFNLAPSGSVKERTANQIKNSTSESAVNLFQSQAYRMSQQELYQIQDEYQRRFNQAPSGSSQERYAMRIRDIARSLLH